MLKHFTSKRLFVYGIIIVIILVIILINLGPNAPSVTTSDNIQVWLTLADGSKKLVQEPGLTFTAGPGNGTVINVDPSTLYQRIEGVGAAMTDSSAWLIGAKLTPDQRAALMSSLFTQDGINLNYIRVPMGASDFALQSYTYNDLPAGQTDPGLENFSISYDMAYIVPVLQQARELNPQLRFMGSPWSAPAWMKTNQSLNGGSLLPEHRQAFADYHVKFIQAYTAAGIPIDAITPQNEPMHETNSYPSMLMMAAEQQTFVRDYLGPALAGAGLDTKILILDHNWDLMNYPLAIMSDPTALAYIEGAAFHCYAGQVENQSIVHAAYPDKGIWFTECSGGEWSTNFGDNMSWNLKNLVIGNFGNWGKSLLLWNIALDENFGPQNGGCANCRGVVTINQLTGEVTYNEEYYVLGHVSKFVSPGAYRAKSTSHAEGGPENVAFLNPDGSLVLIVHSTAASTFDVEWNGQRFTYSLPAKGTVTFKWDAEITPGATVTSEPTNTPAPIATPYPAGILQSFESEGTYYSDYQATASLSTEVAYSGSSSLKSFSESGEWHTVGAYLNDRPINAAGFESICLWVYDTTAADNTMGFRLIDASGASQEFWTDHAAIGSNPKTAQNTWVQMCFQLSAYTLVDLTSLDRVQVAMYWPGVYYFDDITGQ
jgi:glucosylceramidase